MGAPLPEDKKCHEADNNNSVPPTNWIECIGELQSDVNVCYGEVSWVCLLSDDQKADYNQFIVSTDNHFANLCIQHLGAHEHKML